MSLITNFGGSLGASPVSGATSRPEISEQVLVFLVATEPDVQRPVGDSLD